MKKLQKILPTIFVTGIVLVVIPITEGLQLTIRQTMSVYFGSLAITAYFLFKDFPNKEA